MAYINPSLVAKVTHLIAFQYRLAVVWNAITDVSKDASCSPINYFPLLTSVPINVGNTKRNFSESQVSVTQAISALLFFNYFRHFVNSIHHTSSIKNEESVEAPFGCRNCIRLLEEEIQVFQLRFRGSDTLVWISLCFRQPARIRR